MKLTIERKHVHDASIGECFETLVELANSCFVFGVPFSSAKSPNFADLSLSIYFPYSILAKETDYHAISYPF
jgi:hypothetical protein